jgi:hypothetical protein
VCWKSGKREIFGDEGGKEKGMRDEKKRDEG